MNVPPVISWILTGLGFFVAIVLTYHEERMRAITATQEVATCKKQTARPPRGKLTFADRHVIDNLNSQMWNLHGHGDREGITSDYQNNMDTDTILERKCTECGEPRNKRGWDV